jgi:hypothetical protein
MNFKTLYGTGLFGIAGLAAVLLAGCGDASPPAPGTTDTELHGTQTLTIHVPNMGKDLKLM